MNPEAVPNSQPESENQPENLFDEKFMMRLQPDVLVEVFDGDEEAIQEWMLEDREHGQHLREAIEEYLEKHETIDIAELAEAVRERCPELRRLH